MRRIVAVLFGGVALLVSLTPTAGAAASIRAPGGVEQVVFIDYGVRSAAKPSADASSTDFHLLGGHSAWPASSTVNYSVDANGCTNDCTNAIAAVDDAFNTWEVSGITFTRATNGDANPCGGIDSVSWTAIDGPGGVLGETSVCRNPATHEILGFQTVFDSGDPWSDSGDPGHFDIQATASHEEGHAMGLDHVHSPFDVRLTMYPFISNGDIGFRTLGCGEILGVNGLYGTSVDCTGVPLD